MATIPISVRLPLRDRIRALLTGVVQLPAQLPAFEVRLDHRAPTAAALDVDGGPTRRLQPVGPVRWPSEADTAAAEPTVINPAVGVERPGRHRLEDR